MSYIQLIEKTVLPTSLWLTFWDLDDQSQLSLEIAAPTETYAVGQVFSFDRDTRFERLALEPIGDPSRLPKLALLIPVPTGTPPRGKAVDRRSVSIRETVGDTSREHSGFLSLLS